MGMVTQDGGQLTISMEVTMAKVGEDVGVPIGLDETVQLSPLRTFPEVEVVPSVFTMRWKRNENTVLVRLIEQQQGAWRLKQMQVIQEFLQNLLSEALILV